MWKQTPTTARPRAEPGGIAIAAGQVIVAGYTWTCLFLDSQHASSSAAVPPAVERLLVIDFGGDAPTCAYPDSLDPRSLDLDVLRELPQQISIRAEREQDADRLAETHAAMTGGLRPGAAGHGRGEPRAGGDAGRALGSEE